MAMTDRQTVVKHFSEKKKEYPQPVDLALDMRETQIRKRELTGKPEQDYIKKTLDAGYKSPIFTELHKDVVEAQKAASTKKEEPKK